MSKDRNIKTRRTKNIYRYTAAEVAALAGCSESYVKRLRVGLCNQKSNLARTVLAIDELLDDGGNALLQEVERVLNK